MKNIVGITSVASANLSSVVNIAKSLLEVESDLSTGHRLYRTTPN
jgi:hypothetical protein